MLSEYITHVVRSLVACQAMSRRNLAEIMDIDEDQFDLLFGRPAVSDQLQLRHVEALTRFFGARLYEVGFLNTINAETRVWGRGHWHRYGTETPSGLLHKLSLTADRMLAGWDQDHGRNSYCPATAVAEAKGYSELIERCMGMSFVVGMADDDQPEEDKEAEGKVEEAVA